MAFVSIALGAVSIGMGAASAAGAFGGQPVYPNTSASSQALSNTNAEMLPLQRGMEAAAQSGGDYTFSLPNGVSEGSLGMATTGAGWFDGNGNLVSSDPNYGTGLMWSDGNPITYNRGNSNGKSATPPGWYDQTGKLVSTDKNYNPTASLGWQSGTTTMNGVPVTKNADGTYTVSFKGVGQSDVEAQQARENAANQFALSQKYDPQFIAQALQEQNQADPESAAARQQMSGLIQQQINRPLNDPVSEMLNSQVQDTLNAANDNTLTDQETQLLNAAVADSLNSRGGGSGPANFAQPLTSGFAGEQRQANAAQAAMGFLASGSSPEDISYRREQQNLANLSAEVNGKTPQSQFASMSGAQSGPTPMMTASPLPVMPGGQDEAAAQVAIQNAQTANRFNNNQVNPWMQGISGLTDVGSIAGGLGWKPFAPTAPQS